MIVKVRNVFKRFGDYAASNNISFEVEKGSVLGLLGPNGAGKTTMIRMITNILIPDEGTIEIFDQPSASIVQERIGYLPEERGLYKKLKVLDQLVYFGQLKGLNRSDASTRAMKWLTRLDAADWASKKTQELSKGMQQKVQFIAAIMHEPELLILDEPFSGFDPINTELLKKIILDLRREGKTIILSTHIMEQAEQMCDSIVLIDRGRVVLRGNIHEVKKSYKRDTVLIEYEGSDSFLDSFNNLKFISRTTNRVEFRITDGIDSQDILDAALKTTHVYKYEVAEPSLHEIFIDTVSKLEAEYEKK